MDAVMGFFYLYILCFVLLAMGLGMTGLDFDTALSGAATAISNVGPGLGGLSGQLAISARCPIWPNGSCVLVCCWDGWNCSPCW